MAGENITVWKVTALGSDLENKAFKFDNDILKLTQILWRASLQREANLWDSRQQGNY